MDPLKTPCACTHTALRHDTLGACELCPCTDFRNDMTALADAVGVLVPSPRTAAE